MSARTSEQHRSTKETTIDLVLDCRRRAHSATPRPEPTWQDYAVST